MNKNIIGKAGENHLALITTACPQAGIFDAGDNVIKVTIIDDRRSATAGAGFLEVRDSEIRQRLDYFISIHHS